MATMTYMTSSKKILAENIRALIDKSGLTVRGWAISNKLDQRKIDRIVKQDNAVSLDSLDEIADRLGLASWQLICAWVDDQPPHLAITETELKLYARLKELSGR